MAEGEALPSSNAAAAVSEQGKITEEVTGALERQTSNEATIVSAPSGGSESINCNGESSAAAPGADREKTLEFADELAEKGSTAFKENDYAEAADCFSRALEIRVGHYGELAVECLNTYYQYGRALLYKAQEEADPLVSVPKKDGETQRESDKEENTTNATANESSAASVSCNVQVDKNSIAQEGGPETDGNEEEDGSDSDDAGEDDSDLDLAWKMLDVARVISEKELLGDTNETVDILSALAEVALEREDIESSLGDYQKALDILQRIVEADSRQIAELNFRICICLELGSKPLEAIPYCKNAILVCKSRMQRLTNKTTSSVSAASAADDNTLHSSNGSEAFKSGTDNEAEIKQLAGLCEDLEKKLEDLQQLASNPKSILSEILGITAARAGGMNAAPPAELASSQISTVKSSGELDSPTVSAARTDAASVSGVTHLGVVGRGVKRVHMTPVEPGSVKRPATEPPSSTKEGNHFPADNP